LEWSEQMRMNWRERVQIFFSNQNPDRQPFPSWFEVPTRPTEPLAIEEWERDNVIRRFWAARLNGGYTQTNLIIGNTPDRDNLLPSEIPLPYDNDYDLLFDYDVSPCDIPLPDDNDYDLLFDYDVSPSNIQNTWINEANENPSPNVSPVLDGTQIISSTTKESPSNSFGPDIFEDEEDLGLELLFSEDFHTRGFTINDHECSRS
jgi:hypothetical protein